MLQMDSFPHESAFFLGSERQFVMVCLEKIGDCFDARSRRLRGPFTVRQDECARIGVGWQGRADGTDGRVTRGNDL